MANNNNNNPQRNEGRPEDNPFIAFRRYADSQVSSLLNTVFTLPAQIANYNNAHSAREQCLFGKADPKKCEELHALDAHAEKIRHEGAESYNAGDVQSVLKKSEQLMMLEHQAGELRRAILSDAEGSNQSTEQNKQLVEKVDNKKGQQWSDRWDWPEPNGDEDTDDNEFWRWLESRMRRTGGELERMFTRLEEDANQVFGEEIEELRRHWAARNDDTYRCEDAQPQIWSFSRSWQWPPPADGSKQEGVKALEDSYSPSALEADERTKHMGSLWRNAFEDLMRTTQEHPLLSDTQNAHFDQMGLYPLRDYQKELSQLDHQSRERLSKAHQDQVQKQMVPTSDEPSYEYAHDHEDQHDEPSTPDTQRSMETELDAYERLLAPATNASASETDIKSSILSTLTTTERTTAPDGTVTTKVVLKKRFADGSEQSSETIHTQRGQDTHEAEDSWNAMQNAQLTNSSDKKREKKGGWFWSS